jgi:ABC-type phosphate transport system permease subunit
MERRFLSLVLALVAVLVSLTGNLVICWQDWQLYSDIVASPSNTQVWLGGRGIQTIMVSLVTFVIAMPLGVGGVIVSFAQRRVSTGLVSVLAMFFALTPLPLAFWMDGKIIAVTKVTLSQ